MDDVVLPGQRRAHDLADGEQLIANRAGEVAERQHRLQRGVAGAVMGAEQRLQTQRDSERTAAAVAARLQVLRGTFQ